MKIKIITELELKKLKKFKEEFGEKWKDRLLDIFEANVEGFIEDILDYDVEVVDYEVVYK